MPRSAAPARPDRPTLATTNTFYRCHPQGGVDFGQAFKTLGLAVGSTIREIRSAYRRLALETHPDRHPDADYSDAEFKRVREAYETAKDYAAAGAAAGGGGSGEKAEGGRQGGPQGDGEEAEGGRQGGPQGGEAEGGRQGGPQGGGGQGREGARARPRESPWHPDDEPPYRRRTVEEILAEKPSFEALLRCFPSGMAPRGIQRQILSEVHKLLLAGARRIVVSAPTGVGKSAVGAALAQYLETSFVVTSTLHLQDQYARDLDWLRPIKGQRNFECLGIAQEGDRHPASSGSGSGSGRLPRIEASCYAGRHNDCALAVGIAEFCKSTRMVGGPGADAAADEARCPYDLQRYSALRSAHSLWNYATYLQMTHSEKEYEAHRPWLERNVAIFDEAHNAEEAIIDLIGLEVLRAELDECGLEAPSYDLADLHGVMRMLDDIGGEYERMLREEKRIQAGRAKPDLRRATHLQEKADKYSMICDEICLNPANFVVNDPEVDADGSFASVLIKPLSVARYAGSVFRTPVQIFMSATIHKETFCRSMGFQADEVAFVDTPKSPFPLESRRVEFLDVAALSSKRPENEEPVIDEIDRLLTRHAGERGLILTSSRSRCWNILEGLSEANRVRVRICHASNKGGMTQEQVIDEHSRTPGSVLLSSSLWKGADLAGDKSRFQIIAKTPYLNYTEKWARRKKAAEPGWADAYVLTKVLQGMGRSVRSESDHAITYVLDSNTHSLVNKCAGVIPAAYHDALGISR